MDKKYIILIGALILVVIFGVLLFASNRGKNKTTELNWITYDEEEKNFADIIPAFEAANKVKVNFKKIDPNNYEVESLNLISTGKIDVWGIPNTWLPKHHDKLAASPTKDIASIYKKAYPEAISTENIIDGKVYGFPLSADSLVMFSNYNAKSKAITGREFTQEQDDFIAKVPANWDDLAELAKLITLKSNDKISVSVAGLGTDTVPSASDILTLMMLQNGTQMTSDDHLQATFHTAINKFGGESFPGAKALETYTGFANKNSSDYTFNSSLGDPLRAFAENKLIYYIDYLSKESDIKRISPELSYSIHPVPQVKETKNPVSFISYETFTVPQTSKNQLMAWKLVDFITSKENAQSYYRVSKKQPALLNTDADQSNETKIALATAGTWYNPDAQEVNKIFKEMINQVLAGASVQTALDSASIKVTELLGKIQ